MFVPVDDLLTKLKQLEIASQHILAGIFVLLLTCWPKPLPWAHIREIFPSAYLLVGGGCLAQRHSRRKIEDFNLLFLIDSEIAFKAYRQLGRKGQGELDWPRR